MPKTKTEMINAMMNKMEMMKAVQESQVAKNVAPAVQAMNETERQ